jgi:hypothetical protein
VDYFWEQMPTETDFGSFIFKTHRPAGMIDISGPTVMLWMPSMGHGSSPVTVERLSTGVYRASRVFFTMKGDWEIHVQSKDGGEVHDEAVLHVAL